MKKTVYRYYDLDCEIKLAPYLKEHQPHMAAVCALKRDWETLNTVLADAEEKVGNITVDFDTEAKAVSYLKTHAGRIEVTDFHGSFVRVHAGTVEELVMEDDEIVEFVGTVTTSDMPRVTVANSDDHEIAFAAAVKDMDDEIREKVHAEGYDDPQEFFDAYCMAHYEKYGTDFIWNVGHGA